MINPLERKFFINKDYLDTINSLSWFLMDACWMLNYTEVAKLMIPITIVSALCLIYIEKRVSLLFINLGVLFWILMNVSWMLTELNPLLIPGEMKQIFFGMGIVSILLSIIFSSNIKETFSHFKRFRIKKIIKE